MPCCFIAQTVSTIPEMMVRLGNPVDGDDTEDEPTLRTTVGAAARGAEDGTADDAGGKSAISSVRNSVGCDAKNWMPVSINHENGGRIWRPLTHDACMITAPLSKTTKPPILICCKISPTRHRHRPVDRRRRSRGGLPATIHRHGHNIFNKQHLATLSLTSHIIHRIPIAHLFTSPCQFLTCDLHWHA